jgi:iron complex outermembrane receptor protein
MNRILGHVGAGAAAAFAVTMPAAALAQDTTTNGGAAAHAAQADDEGRLTEVVVTARRRSESLQSVPVAVTALSPTNLAQQGIVGPTQLSRVTPSLQTTTNPGSQNSVLYTLRGQGTGEPNLAQDQAVGTYQDGVYIPRPAGATASFFDLERVEVLKGPQGTLFGRNTTGGAINILTRGADFDGYHGYVSAELGNYKDVQASAAVNIPLVDDKLAVRVALQRWFRQGYGHSLVTGQHIGGDHDDTVARASIRFNPTDRLTIDLKGEYTRASLNGLLAVPRVYVPSASAGQNPSGGFGGPVVSYADPGGIGSIEAATELGLLPSFAGGLIAGGRGDFLGLFGYPPAAANAALAAGAGAILNAIKADNADGFYTNSTNLVQFDRYHHIMLGGTLTYDITDHVQFKSITGYRKYEQNTGVDTDGTQFGFQSANAGPFVNNQPTTRDHYFSQEGNLSGNSFDGRLIWVAGAYYSSEAGSDITGGQSVPAINPYAFLNDAQRVTSKTWSVYTQDDFKVTDRLTLTGGVRYTEERKFVNSESRFLDLGSLVGTPLTGNNQAFTGVGGSPTAITNLTGPRYVCSTGVNFTSGVNAGFPLVTTNPADCAASKRGKFTGVSYLASANYQVLPDVLLYVKTSRGFRGGSVPFRDITKPVAQPEKATDIEVGVKGDFLDRRLRVNVAAYRTKYDNKQETVLSPVSGAWANSGLSIYLSNAAKATIHGFEGEVYAKPTSRLSISGSVSYLRGKYDSYPNAFTLTGVPVGDVSGERLEVPEWQYSLSASYELDVPGGKLVPAATWSWIDGSPNIRRNIDPALGNLPNQLVNTYGGLNSLGSLGLLSLRVDYNMEKGMSVSFFMNNALNKKYAAAALTEAFTGGVQSVYPGEPRMFGFILRKSFGD